MIDVWITHVLDRVRRLTERPCFQRWYLSLTVTVAFLVRSRTFNITFSRRLYFVLFVLLLRVRFLGPSVDSQGFWSCRRVKTSSPVPGSSGTLTCYSILKALVGSHLTLLTKHLTVEMVSNLGCIIVITGCRSTSSAGKPRGLAILQWVKRWSAILSRLLSGRAKSKALVA